MTEALCLRCFRAVVKKMLCKFWKILQMKDFRVSKYTEPLFPPFLKQELRVISAHFLQKLKLFSHQTLSTTTIKTDTSFSPTSYIFSTVIKFYMQNIVKLLAKIILLAGLESKKTKLTKNEKSFVWHSPTQTKSSVKNMAPFYGLTI